LLCAKFDLPTAQVMVKNLERELVMLRRELAMHDTLANRSQVSYEPLSEQRRYEIRQQVRAYLDGKGDDIEVRVILRRLHRILGEIVTAVLCPLCLCPKQEPDPFGRVWTAKLCIRLTDRLENAHAKKTSIAIFRIS